jgi:predicted permease
MSIWSRIFREQSNDFQLITWLDALRADTVFGWRQLKKNRVASAAAVLSLALAIGACTSAFRLIDALLLRPLPVANTDRLYSMANKGYGPSGDFRISDSLEYPLLRRMRTAVQDSAVLIAVSFADRVDVTYGSDEEMEKASRQYVSACMFQAFGIQPAVGRVLNDRDDLQPGAHPYTVISHDYWTRRLRQDPAAVGRKVRIGEAMYEIVGVAAAPFTGTETGTAVDFFVPAMMNPHVTRSDASWFRPLVVLNQGADPQIVQSKLQVVSRAFQEERARGFVHESKQYIERFLNQTVFLEPASSGASGLQRTYERPLLALALFAALVLLIACANVANLMSAQTASRAKEMALRVSIGAGRLRLVQLVLVESLWLGALSATLGGAMSWLITPLLVARINPPDNPASLLLPADWRVVSFAAALAFFVTFLFGLMPALRASGVRPIGVLRGSADPHARSRLMHSLIAIQTALCLVVLFAASLFVATLDRLTNQPLGFNSDRLLALETKSSRPLPAVVWDQTAARLRSVAGVESVGLASWPLLIGTGWNGNIWVNGVPTEVLSYFLGVSPEWRDTMKITLLEGRDFRPGETAPGVALVNEAFVKQCLGGSSPIGRFFEKGNGTGQRFQVIGVVRNARYRNLREPITPRHTFRLQPSIRVATPFPWPQPLSSFAHRLQTRF